MEVETHRSERQKEDMISIDGAEGGGQLLRTALSLSTITETPFEIEEIRGNRSNPGLRPQHLAAVELVAELCDAEVEGAELESDAVTFRPGSARRTPLAVDIGTAGSVTLLFDTVLPIAATSEEPFELTAAGGTNVKWSPTVEFHQFVKLPLVAEWGFDATIALEKTGFYPTGGGKAQLSVTPRPLQAFELEERGELEGVEIYSKASEDLADPEVAERQANHARKELEGADFPAETCQVEYVSTRSAGSSLLLRGVYEHSVVGVDELGERGKPSEAVADDAVEQFETVHAGGAPVDAFMADQLMVVLALAGGRVRIPTVTEHVETNLALINKFGSDLGLERPRDDLPVLVASPSPEFP